MVKIRAALVLLLVAALSFIAASQDITSAGYSIFGRSATFSLVSNINNKSNDAINQTNDYVSAVDGDLLLALVSSSGFGTKNNTAYNGLSYLLEMRQPLDAKLFITFTKGSENDAKKKIDSIKLYKIVDTRFGGYNITAPESFPLIMRLEYDDIDVIGRSILGPGAREIVVENIGRNANNVTKIRITVKR